MLLTNIFFNISFSSGPGSASTKYGMYITRWISFLMGIATINGIMKNDFAIIEECGMHKAKWTCNNTYNSSVISLLDETACTFTNCTTCYINTHERILHFHSLEPDIVVFFRNKFNPKGPTYMLQCTDTRNHSCPTVWNKHIRDLCISGNCSATSECNCTKVRAIDVVTAYTLHNKYENPSIVRYNVCTHTRELIQTREMENKKLSEIKYFERGFAQKRNSFTMIHYNQGKIYTQTAGFILLRAAEVYEMHYNISHPCIITLPRLEHELNIFLITANGSTFFRHVVVRESDYICNYNLLTEFSGIFLAIRCHTWMQIFIFLVGLLMGILLLLPLTKCMRACTNFKLFKYFKAIIKIVYRSFVCGCIAIKVMLKAIWLLIRCCYNQWIKFVNYIEKQRIN